jgi:hypothetical protein
MTAKGKSVRDYAVDAALYVPVGAFLAAREEVPKLAAKGRAYVTTQLTMARTVGNFAVTFGSREAEKQLLKAVRRLGSLWGEPPVGGAPAGMQDGREADRPFEEADESSAEQASGAVTSNGSSGHLAIVGYDALSASQVVQRLAGLTHEELEQVRAYEAATRSRATILNRAAQLLSASGD